MTDYPTLAAEPTIEWGPGWSILGDGDQRDLDAALSTHELSLDGGTIASLEITTSAGASRAEGTAGIELTRQDCVVLATRLLAIAAASS